MVSVALWTSRNRFGMGRPLPLRTPSAGRLLSFLEDTGFFVEVALINGWATASSFSFSKMPLDCTWWSRTSFKIDVIHSSLAKPCKIIWKWANRMGNSYLLISQLPVESCWRQSRRLQPQTSSHFLNYHDYNHYYTSATNTYIFSAPSISQGLLKNTIQVYGSASQKYMLFTLLLLLTIIKAKSTFDAIIDTRPPPPPPPPNPNQQKKKKKYKKNTTKKKKKKKNKI